MANKTVISRGGQRTVIVRRPASEGGTYSYTESTKKRDREVSRSIKGGSNNPTERQATLETVQQEQFNKLTSEQQQKEIDTITQQNIEAKRQQEEFLKANPYGYTSTSGELVGSPNPQALTTNLYLQRAEEIRRARSYSPALPTSTQQNQGLYVYTDDSGRSGYTTTQDAYDKSQAFAPNYVASSVTGGVLTQQQAKESAQDNRFIRRLKTSIMERDKTIQSFGERPLIQKSVILRGFDSRGTPQYRSQYDLNVLQSGWLGAQQSRDRVVLFGSQVVTQPRQTASQVAKFTVQTIKSPISTGGTLWTGLKSEYKQNPTSFITGGAVEVYTGTKAFNLFRQGVSSSYVGRYIARTTQRVRTERASSQFDFRLPTPSTGTVFETPNFKTASFQGVPNLYGVSSFRGVTVQTVQSVRSGGFDVPRVPKAFIQPDGTVKLKNPYTLPTQGRQVQLSPREYNPIQKTNSEFLAIRQRLEREYQSRTQSTLQNFGVQNPVPSQTRAGLYYLDTRTTGLYKGFQRQASLNEYRGVTVQKPGQGVKRFYVMAIPFPIPERTINIGTRSFTKFESEFRVFGQGVKNVAEKLEAPTPVVSRDIPIPFKSFGQESTVQNASQVFSKPIQNIINRGERVRSASVSSLNIINRQSSQVFQNVLNRTRQAGSQSFRQQSQTQQKQKQILSFFPGQALVSKQPPRQPTPADPRPFSPERILPRTPFRPLTPSPRREQGFNVLTRKGGVFVQANPLSLPKAQALNFGANLIRTTARASFKIVESGSPARGTYQTRGSLVGLIRKASGVFIEPRSQRINSPGELAEITFKGQKTRRSKKKRWLGL